MGTTQGWFLTVLNKSWKQYSAKEQLYGHLRPISQSIQEIWERYTATAAEVVMKLEAMFSAETLRREMAVLNKSWKQYSSKEKLYSHLRPISQSIQEIWERYAATAAEVVMKLEAMFSAETLRREIPEYAD